MKPDKTKPKLRKTVTITPTFVRSKLKRKVSHNTRKRKRSPLVWNGSLAHLA